MNLRIPILVQHGDEDNSRKTIRLNPLFLPNPEVSDRLFDRAMNKMKTELRNYFAKVKYTSAKESLEWLLFAPKLKEHRFQFRFKTNKHFFDGYFLVISFKAGNNHFALVPSLNQDIFIVSEGSLQHLKTRSEVFITNWLKDYERDRDEVYPDAFYSTKKEFVTFLNLDVSIPSSNMKFEEEGEEMVFAAHEQRMGFSGEVELNKVAISLNHLFPGGLKRAFERDELISKIRSFLFQGKNRAFVLLGPKGVGRHAIIHEALFQQINDESKVQAQGIERIWQLDPSRIIAGMSIVGQWEKRFESIIQALKHPTANPDKSDVLLIDKVVTLLTIGKSGSSNMTLSKVLKPTLEKSELKVAMIASEEEWEIVQERERGFSDLFQIIRIEEPDDLTTTKMVLSTRKLLERNTGSSFDIDSLQAVFKLSRGMLNQEAKPGSIIRLLEQLAIKRQFQTISAAHVLQAKVAYGVSNSSIIDGTYALDEKQLSRRINSALVGQPAAQEALLSVIQLLRAKLNRPNKPVFSMLFIGPTGVGKTQAAKVLSSIISEDESQLLRFDMNEFIDGGAVARLIGGPFKEEGLLTSKVRLQPFGVLLFDEIEKAHSTVHDLLLQILDDSRLTDSLGRTVNFSNITIIMTSNLGAKEANQKLGFNSKGSDLSAIYNKAIRLFFKPEFINRIDKIVNFQNLAFEHILSIANLQIKALLSREGFVRRTTLLNVSNDAIRWVAERGYDAQMGGRALKRQIERDLTALTADQLVKSNKNLPILFNIDLKEDALIPQILEIDFVNVLRDSWLPNIPDEEDGKPFLVDILKRITKIQNTIEKEELRRHDVSGKAKVDDWLYYDFKRRVDEFNEMLSTMLLGYGSRFFKRTPAVALRLKKDSSIRLSQDRKNYKQLIKDRIFQEEGFQEFKDSLHINPGLFNVLKSEFLNIYLDCKILELFSEGFVHEHNENLVLEFSTLSENFGKHHIGVLMDFYVKLLEHLEIEVSQISDFQIKVEGFGLEKLLINEVGIHLFSQDKQTMIPLHLNIVGKKRRLKIVRYYDQEYITDIRTGMNCPSPISEKEMKLLMIAPLL